MRTETLQLEQRAIAVKRIADQTGCYGADHLGVAIRQIESLPGLSHSGVAG